MEASGNLSDLQLALLDRNIIDLCGQVDERMVVYVREAIFRLRVRGSPPIEVSISSGGGHVSMALDIYDFLRLYTGVKIGVVTMHAASMAAIILQACSERHCAKHATILIHHISQGSVSLDVLRSPRRIKSVRRGMEEDQHRIDQILLERTKRTLSEIRRVCREERPMSPEDALEFGLIDKII